MKSFVAGMGVGVVLIAGFVIWKWHYINRWLVCGVWGK